MEKIKDGGPAFPRPAGPYIQEEGGCVHSEEIGMTLRDYFAAAALTGIVAAGRADILAAWGYADAMLAEREKRP